MLEVRLIKDGQAENQEVDSTIFVSEFLADELGANWKNSYTVSVTLTPDDGDSKRLTAEDDLDIEFVDGTNRVVVSPKKVEGGSKLAA